MRIKELRERLGMSQKQLAAALGVAPSAVSDWESGNKQPSGKRLVQIADYFCVSLDTVVGRKVISPGVLEDDDLRIISIARGVMAPADKKRMMDVLRVVFQEAFDVVEGKSQ